MNRRGFLGALLTAPIVAPALVKAAEATEWIATNKIGSTLRIRLPNDYRIRGGPVMPMSYSSPQEDLYHIMKDWDSRLWDIDVENWSEQDLT